MLTSCPRPPTRSGQRHRDSQDSSLSDRQPFTVSEAPPFGRARTVVEALPGGLIAARLLPPYGPEFKRIENGFVKLASHLRRRKMSRKIVSGTSAALHRAPRRRQSATGPDCPVPLLSERLVNLPLRRARPCR